MSRTRTMTGISVITTAALVLIFGNQAVTEWVANHTRSTSVLGWYLRVLGWPSWAFGPNNDTAPAMRDLLAHDLRAIFLLLFVAMITAVVAKSVSGGAGAFFLGWASVVFASAFAAFVTAFVVAHPTFLGALAAASGGSAYGLFAGWIVGIAATTAKKSG